MREYLLEIFNFNRKGVLFIWFLDILDAILGLYSTFLLGKTIDSLIDGDYIYFCKFLCLSLFLAILSFVNNYYDNRVYAKVLKDTILHYTQKAYKNGDDVSTVSARVGYVESLVDVIHFYVLDFAKIVIGICFVIGYLLLNEYIEISIITLIFAFISGSIIWRLKYRRLKIQSELNDEEEKQINYLETREQSFIRRHFLRLFSAQIKLSDIDAKSSLWIELLQIIHIAIALVLLVNSTEPTAGVIYTVIAYLSNLNNYAISIPFYHQHYLWLKDVINRIK